MKADEILKLLDAGFTADEIRKMQLPEELASEVKVAEPVPEVKPAELEVKPEEPETKPAAAPSPDPLDMIREQISGLTEVVDRMSKSIVMPTMEDVKPLGIDDIITKFFKED